MSRRSVRSALGCSLLIDRTGQETLVETKHGDTTSIGPTPGLAKGLIND